MPSSIDRAQNKSPGYPTRAISPRLQTARRRGADQRPPPGFFFSSFLASAFAGSAFFALGFGGIDSLAGLLRRQPGAAAVCAYDERGCEQRRRDGGQRLFIGSLSSVGGLRYARLRRRSGPDVRLSRPFGRLALSADTAGG
ncbi:MAG: hypothetical protein IPM30_00010 [Burkholderiales bacterium]|nr:hypothetical protein [Burkholderiales bacterium]